MKSILPSIALFLSLAIACSPDRNSKDPIHLSGIYPHLACYNNEDECGTGAVVPWADRLWVISYGPHLPFGSSDKLYEITPDLQIKPREESIGGTPANRMIHAESRQLFIGPYAIGENRMVRAIPYENMPGRHTGNARHLVTPDKKIYYATMEEGLYEVDVKTLEVTTLFKDENIPEGGYLDNLPENPHADFASLAGAHGKGLYSGQGVLVYSNNGESSPEAQSRFDTESGALYEWNGISWKLIRRNQFVEVTGPGGIYGNANPDIDPIWATGWDHKSMLLGVRNPRSGWDFYRLPKASHSYDGAHGWNTEWPRIRDVGTKENPDYLMTMHGLFWRFPGNFTLQNSSGIRPRSAYLKVIGDFARWNGKLVFGCDDSAQKEFLNKRKAKGGIEGPGQSNSNLWFTSIDQPDQLGPNTAGGAVWLSEEINAGEYSEPMLFAGWPHRIAWIKNEGEKEVTFTLEIDKSGEGNWAVLKNEVIDRNSSFIIYFSQEEKGEWIRVKANASTKATVHFSYSDDDQRSSIQDDIFTGMASVHDNEAIGGLLYGLGKNRRSLGVLAFHRVDGQLNETGYYELDSAMNFVQKEDPETANFIREKCAIPKNVVSVEESSLLIIDDSGRRWRLPLGDHAYTDLTNAASLRICREVATERDLFNCHGTFYELPAENADGYAKIRPVASHNLQIHDYASYRGMLIMTGLSNETNADNSHIFISNDGKAKIWAGAIDDLWKLGKPRGQGGPWKNSDVKSGQASDPYLIGFYDKKELSISHDSKDAVRFRIEAEPVGHGPWMLYKEVTVHAGESFEYEFPESFQARWIRFVADKDCKATTWLVYK